MSPPPVLYLDLDDTVISWADGRPHAALGAREFILWALESFEVRWLTTWCPNGELESRLLHDLCRMLDLSPDRLRHVRGFDWEAGDSKLNGIAWLEHLVLERPFVWVEDDYGMRERERIVLSQLGLLDSYFCCNVTEHPDSLARVHQTLRERVASEEEAA